MSRRAPAPIFRRRRRPSAIRRHGLPTSDANTVKEDRWCRGGEGPAAGQRLHQHHEERGGAAATPSASAAGTWPTTSARARKAGFGNPCNCVSALSNGIPTQVQVLLGGERVEERSADGWPASSDDTWRIRPPRHALARTAAGSLSAEPCRAGGARRDKHSPQMNSVLTFNDWGPRTGLNADLTGGRQDPG